MKQFNLRGALLAAALLSAATPLASCNTAGKFDVFSGAQTNSQKFFAAQAEYTALLNAAVTYSNSKIAQRPVVAGIASVNNRVQPALRAGNTYFGCAGDQKDLNVLTNCTLKAGMTLTSDQTIQTVLQGIIDLRALLPSSFLSNLGK